MLRGNFSIKPPTRCECSDFGNTACAQNIHVEKINFFPKTSCKNTSSTTKSQNSHSLRLWQMQAHKFIYSVKYTFMYYIDCVCTPFRLSDRGTNYEYFNVTVDNVIGGYMQNLMNWSVKRGNGSLLIGSFIGIIKIFELFIAALNSFHSKSHITKLCSHTSASAFFEFYEEPTQN